MPTFSYSGIPEEPDPAQRVRAVADAILAAPVPLYGAIPPGRRYVLPCAVLGLGGLYEYVLIDVSSARRWLLEGPCESYVTHPLLKEALDQVIGFVTPPPCKEPLPCLGYQDEGLVFTLEGYETLWLQSRGSSRRIRELVQAERYTLGFLRRLA